MAPIWNGGLRWEAEMIVSLSSHQNNAFSEIAASGVANAGVFRFLLPVRDGGRTALTVLSFHASDEAS